VNLNGGLFGVLVVGILIGITSIYIEERSRCGRSGPLGYIVLAIFVTALFQQESPLGIILASGLQALVVLFILWRVAVILSGHWSWRPASSRMERSGARQEALT
jgi:hypothetical protein